MKILVLIVIKFFFISALFIVSNGNLDLKESTGRAVFVEAYTGWLGDLSGQGLKIVREVASSQWLPSESSIDDAIDAQGESNIRR